MRRSYFERTAPKPIYRAIFYKTKEPEVYNKGTDYESSHDTFLAYYTCLPLEQAKIEADNLNTERPKTLKTGETIDWDNIDYFFAGEQELFDSF